MMDKIISAKNVELKFGKGSEEVVALKNISLEVGAGEFVSFIGPSGCGKTTFLRTVAALENPTSGQILVNGVSPDEARINRAYGYVFQSAGLYPWRNISKNVSLPLEIMNYSREEISKRVSESLNLVELYGFEKKFPWQLSG